MEPDRALPGTFVRFLDRRMVRTQLGLHHNLGAVTQATGTELIVATEGPQAVRCLRSDVAIKRLREGRHRELRWTLGNLLPYGRWTCADGRQVLFNREFQCIWQRASEQAPATAINPHEYIPFVAQEFFYDNVNPTWVSHATRQKCLGILAAWGRHGCEPFRRTIPPPHLGWVERTLWPQP